MPIIQKIFIYKKTLRFKYNKKRKNDRSIPFMVRIKAKGKNHFRTKLKLIEIEIKN